MWRTARRARRARARPMARPTPTRARPASRVETRTVRAPRPRAQRHLERPRAPRRSGGGRRRAVDATPCEASGSRRPSRSTGSPLVAAERQSQRQLRRVARGGARHRRRRNVHRCGLASEDGEVRTAKVPTRRRRRSRSSRRRARSARTTSSASRTARRSRRTRCSSGKGARTAFVTNAGFEHCSTCAGRRARTSTGSARRTPSRSCRSSAATACAGAWRRRESSSRSTSRRFPLRRGGGRDLPALLVPRPGARARGRGRGAARLPARARRRIARAGAGVPRVRARIDDRRRRVSRTASSRGTCARSRPPCATPGSRRRS